MIKLLNYKTDEKSDVARHVRAKAAQALGELKCVQAVDQLIESLQDKDPIGEVKEAAIVALGKIGDEKAVEPLTKLLEMETGLLY